MALLLKQLPCLKNVPVVGENIILLRCRHCSSSSIHDNDRTDGSSQRRKCSRPFPHVFPSTHSAFQSTVFKSKYLIPTGDVRTVMCAHNRFPNNCTSTINDTYLSKTLFNSVILNNNFTLQSSLKQYRYFQTSSVCFDKESKVEKTVKALKEEKEEKEKQLASVSESKSIEPAKKSLREKFVAVVKHYYHGFRLLFIDMGICSKLIWRILNGKSLTRRESNQLVRTTADMFRLVPFLVFIIIPFAEFLLPVALKLFPGMLPSTFEEEKDRTAKNKRNLTAKIEMAKFLQKTIEESAVEAKKKDGQTVESFGAFIEQIRKEGVRPDTKDIMKFAKLFEDEITLDNLTRQQLRACCTMLNITPIGTDALLRFLLEMKLRGLLADDQVIEKEGVDSLNISELQAANRARGMRALGVPEERLRAQLNQWLTLHLKEQIPTSLLLLSRTLYLPDTLSLEEKLGATIQKLPVTAADEAKVKVAEMVGETVDNKTKMEIIKREEEIIAAEKEEQLIEERMMNEKVERDRAEALAAESAMKTELRDPAISMDLSADEVLKDTALLMDKEAKKEALNKCDITAEDLEQLEDVLEEVAKEKKINIASDSLKELKEDVDEYKEDLDDLKDASLAEQKVIKESKAAKRLSKKVQKMIARVESKLHYLEEKKNGIKEKLLYEQQSLKEEMEDSQQAKQQINQYNKKLVTIDEVMDTLRRLKKTPDEAKLVKMFDALDVDKDGNIDVNEALQFLDVLTEVHSSLSEAQLEEINTILKHEEILEDEKKKEEKVKKEEEKVKKEAEDLLKEQHKQN